MELLIKLRHATPPDMGVEDIRVSCFVALLYEQRRGWSREQADAHIARLWQPNADWRAFLRSVREGGKVAR